MISHERDSSEQNKSVGWVAVMLALAVAYFGWGFLAADYFQHDPGDGPREANFWINTITQLPNLSSVLRYGFEKRLWLIVLIAIGEIVVVILWRVMRKLDRELWGK
jgi:hypothetical protein